MTDEHCRRIAKNWDERLISPETLSMTEASTSWHLRACV